MTIKIITNKKNLNEEAEKEAYRSLIGNFNKLAKEKNIKYKLTFKGYYPTLFNGKFGFENYSNKIVSKDDGFTFRDELCPDILEEIKPILEKLKELFIIEINSLEVTQ